MDENITRGLFNPDSLTEASKGKVKAIDAYLIKENKLNEIYPQDDIDGLKENIWEFQLSQPIVVRKNKDGTYTIISGHRRFKACMELFEEGKALHHISYVGDGFIYMSYDGADMMSDDDKLRSRVNPTDLTALFNEKYGHLKSSEGSFNTKFFAWKIDKKTNAPKEFYADTFIDTINGELVASIPAVDNGEAFATEEECLAHREKCQLVDFDDEEPTEEREPTKKELLDQWLDKQQMSLDELRDIIND